MKEINELLAVKQRAKPSHGVEQFSYYTTNNCDHKVSHATGICDKPYNVASPKDSIVLTNVDNEKLKFVNTGILLDTGDLFDDLLDEETAKRIRKEKYGGKSETTKDRRENKIKGGTLLLYFLTLRC